MSRARDVVGRDDDLQVIAAVEVEQLVPDVVDSLGVVLGGTDVGLRGGALGRLRLRGR
jgi:hypothetical protein